ncbi:uncharacterized protein TNCV_3841031 [Trichonephila clavipes]|nr:uncharacterized protein TNCV_3841031 [Trichonephila clavipes]
MDIGNRYRPLMHLLPLCHKPLVVAPQKPRRGSEGDVLTLMSWTQARKKKVNKSGHSLPQSNLSVQSGTQGDPHSWAQRGHLTGRALDWFDVLGYRVVEDKATDYAHFKQTLTEQFSMVRNRSELEIRFYASFQKHNQKPSGFVYELLKIHKQLKLDMREEKLLDHVTSSLEPQLLNYVEEGSIRPIQSPYTSLVVFTRKNSGLSPDSPEAYRFAIDYRKLNAITKYPRYLLPVIDNLIANIPHTAIMSTLDLKSGFFQSAINL